MYRLLRARSAHQLAAEQAPTLVGALLISEPLYRFHSFTLECLAFLATWWLLDGLLSRIMPRARAGAPWGPHSNRTVKGG